MNHRKPPQRESMKRKATSGTCRWCDQPITKGGRTWHPACAKEFKLIHWPAETRKAVYKRDKGVCARCKIDTVQQAFEENPHWPSIEWARERLKWGGSGRYWQHDHIRPLVEANGDISFWLLDNCQTLCTACHIAKGKEDNARRKAARQNEERTLFVMDSK